MRCLSSVNYECDDRKLETDYSDLIFAIERWKFVQFEIRRIAYRECPLRRPDKSTLDIRTDG